MTPTGASSTLFRGSATVAEDSVGIEVGVMAVVIGSELRGSARVAIGSVVSGLPSDERAWAGTLVMESVGEVAIVMVTGASSGSDLRSDSRKDCLAGGAAVISRDGVTAV